MILALSKRPLINTKQLRKDHQKQFKLIPAYDGGIKLEKEYAENRETIVANTYMGVLCLVQ